MKIGIDIDDTITDTWETMMPYYIETFGLTEQELDLTTPYYGSLKNMIPLDKYYQEIIPIYDNVSKFVPLKENVCEVLNILHNLGYEIIFITARGKGYTDAYKTTIQYLANNNVYYDNLLTNVIDKGQVCEDKKIDLFIDDSVKNCEKVSEHNIDVLMFKTKFNALYPKFKKFDNWLDILTYILSKEVNKNGKSHNK